MHIPAENVHWLFGISMQIIATFVGLLAAGFFFFHDRLENEMERDETLREIYDEVKKQYYLRFKTLFAITGVSIIMGFWVLYATAAGIEFYNGAVEAAVWLLHMFNLVLAGWLFIFMVDPDIIQHTAQRLAKRNSRLFNPDKAHGISQQEFIGKFSALDKILRAVSFKANPQQAFMTFVEMIKDLHERGIITAEQLEELKQISTARNISTHSRDEKIESLLGTTADKLNKELNMINDKTNKSTAV